MSTREMTYAALLTACAAMMTMSANSYAQDAASEVVEVTVTGSRIRRDALSAPTPLIQIERESVTKTGKASVIDVLADIPALSGSVVPEDTTGAGLNDGGLSLLNLRDLGTARTLVLVDGRRHVGSSIGSLAVDIDTIPRLLIDKSEVITGASSAQYGADAVSGVVNFILRKNIQGLEADVSGAQINSDGQINQRVSLLGGYNFFDDRLNVYASLEHEENEEVRDSDLDWRARAFQLVAQDFDPASAPDDGIVDSLLLGGVRNISRSRGGTLTLVNDIAPDASRNIPFQTCPAGTTGVINANCIFPEPGRTYQFSNTGAARLANFGTFRNNVGRTRNLNVGGDGLNVNTEFSQFSRLPESKNDRFQGGVNFRLTDSLELFGEVKYVEESTFDEAQQTFFDIGIVNIAANANGGLFALNSFNVGLDNAYLDPALRTAILANTRPTFNAAGAQTGTVADPRARISIFGPSRSQLNEKEMRRFVVGLRGERESLGFVNALSYEVSFTSGQLENVNFERAVDSVRFKHSVDAVVDTLGRVNGRPGEIVCRVRLLAANGVTIPDQFRGGNYSPTHPEIANCVPSRLFGEDGFNQAAIDYFGAEIAVRQKNKQDDALAYVSGNLWDFWGAGPLGLALGAEYRKETTEGTGRSTSTGDRLLFLNTGPDFPEVSYDAKELFGEVRLPLLKDVFMAKSAEIGAAFRRSDYSTVDAVSTHNLNAIWRPSDDLTLRATIGKAVRVPNLVENFGPPTQTFANGFTDPCSAAVIAGLTDAVVRANRLTNCPLAGVPTGTNITYAGGIPGRNAGNPFLLPETSHTRTYSAVLTPRFWPKSSFVLDYYEIEITDVISAVSAQIAANQCVSGVAVNSAICATITRTGAAGSGTIPPYGLVDFIQGAVNYAKLVTHGIDFQYRYKTDVNELFGFGQGKLDVHLRGNYLLKSNDHFNIAIPAERTRNETFQGFPRLRWVVSVDWDVSDKLALEWEMDWQSEQTITDPNTLLGNNDISDLRYLKTRPFIQHDFRAQYSPMENLELRAGVVNLADEKPSLWLGNTTQDNFDFFGRRFFIGVNYTMK
jgi:outer membrane receptor protein involved in Fe transport